MNREGKGGKYMKKGFSFCPEIKKERKERLYKEKENILFVEEKKQGRKRREIFGEGEYVFCKGEEKR